MTSFIEETLHKLLSLKRFYLAIIFLILPLAHSVYLGDNFTVIKWILTYFLTFLITLRLIYQNQLNFPNMTMTSLIGALLIIKSVLLISKFSAVSLVSFIDSISFIFLSFYSLQLFSKDSNIMNFRSIIMFGTLVTAFKALYTLIDCKEFIGNSSHECFGSSFGNINMLAEYFVLILPLLFYYYLSSKNIFQHIVSGLNILISIIILFFSHSRSAQLGTIMFLFFYFLNNYKNKKSLVLIGLCILSIAIGELRWNSYSSTIKILSKQASTQSRLDLLKSSLNMALNSPLGTGLGGYEFNFNLYKMDGEFKPTEDTLDKSPHNEFLFWTIENGWIYLFFLIIFIFFLVKNYLLTFFKDNEKHVIIGVVIVLIPQLLFQFPFDNGFSFCFLSFISGYLFSFGKNNQIIAKKTFTSMIVFSVASTLFLYNFFGFTLSRISEYNFSDNQRISNIACFFYPSNWKPCLNLARIESQNPKGLFNAQSILLKELNRRPLNYLATKLWIDIKLRNHQPISCKLLFSYDKLFNNQSSIHEFITFNCEKSDLLIPSKPNEFQKYYQSQISQLKLNQ